MLITHLKWIILIISIYLYIYLSIYMCVYIYIKNNIHNFILLFLYNYYSTKLYKGSVYYIHELHKLKLWNIIKQYICY